jgi:formylglycine-generating enzyme required for sulfatase activity
MPPRVISAPHFAIVGAAAMGVDTMEGFDDMTPGREIGREQRAAIVFLEWFVAERAAGRSVGLAAALARFPEFESVVAREWLLAAGHSAGAPREPSEEPTAKDDDDGRVGPYRIVRELGRGGQGTVYLAEDTRVGRTVALKLLPRSLRGLDSTARLRLRREAQALARLDHPGLATVYELGETADSAWIAMRYVAGGSLQQVIASRAASGAGPPRAPADLSALVRLFERAARALDAAHAAGILHRDVKPANVLLAADDEPVLVDFGLARDAVDDAPTITASGALFGTLVYLAPERLEGAPADAPGDVYALGATLYESLTLARPFQSATTAAELRAIAGGEAPDVRAANPAVSRDLARVTATALARDPAARYRTAAAFADDLARVSARRPIAARPPTALDRFVRFCQRERALAVSIGIVFGVLLVGLVTVTWLWRANRESLASVSRLADLKLARELRQREDELWPVRHERVPAMRRWLEDAIRLRGRTPQHARLHAALPAPGVDETADWQRDQLEALASELGDIDARIEAVEARVVDAVELAQRTQIEPAAAWAAARARVRADPVYDGIDLAPQLGLVPLGPDPVSGLEEFAHVGSGSIPERAAGGALQLDDRAGIVLVLVPGGLTVLGADRVTPPDGRPANVDIDAPLEQSPSYEIDLSPYFLGKFELTQAQWTRHVGWNPSTYQEGASATLTRVEGARHPVELVTWAEVDRVLRQLGLRLPTEAQWEHAYRAGTRTPYPYGEDERSVAGHENLADLTAQQQGTNRQLRYVEWLDDGRLVHAPVGSFAPNRWGFHDMGGNVKEWCDDSWEDYRAVAPRAGDGLRRGEFERYRMVRGGCFSSYVDEARAAARYAGEKDTRGAEAGVRPARDLDR